jgi:WhiB family transcriptional regulator, redox-sensing transcriptional regulator
VIALRFPADPRLMEAHMPVPLSDLPLVDLLDLLAEGECRFDPELHTGPDKPESVPEYRARVDAAKAVCDECPVWAACLEYALRTRPRHGVIAGLTPHELSALATTVRTEQNAEAA